MDRIHNLYVFRKFFQLNFELELQLKSIHNVNDDKWKSCLFFGRPYEDDISKPKANRVIRFVKVSCTRIEEKVRNSSRPYGANCWSRTMQKTGRCIKRFVICIKERPRERQKKVGPGMYTYRQRNVHLRKRTRIVGRVWISPRYAAAPTTFHGSSWPNNCRDAPHVSPSPDDHTSLHYALRRAFNHAFPKLFDGEVCLRNCNSNKYFWYSYCFLYEKLPFSDVLLDDGNFSGAQIGSAPKHFIIICLKSTIWLYCSTIFPRIFVEYVGRKKLFNSKVSPIKESLFWTSNIIGCVELQSTNRNSDWEICHLEN